MSKWNYQVFSLLFLSVSYSLDPLFRLPFSIHFFITSSSCSVHLCLHQIIAWLRQRYRNHWKNQQSSWRRNTHQGKRDLINIPNVSLSSSASIDFIHCQRKDVKLILNQTLPNFFSFQREVPKKLDSAPFHSLSLSFIQSKVSRFILSFLDRLVLTLLSTACSAITVRLRLLWDLINTITINNNTFLLQGFLVILQTQECHLHLH